MSAGFVVPVFAFFAVGVSVAGGGGLGETLRDPVTIGILAGSLISALLAMVVLRARNRHYQRVCAAEERDTDADGIPDFWDDDTVRR